MKIKTRRRDTAYLNCGCGLEPGHFAGIPESFVENVARLPSERFDPVAQPTGAAVLDMVRSLLLELHPERRRSRSTSTAISNGSSASTAWGARS